jgi:hypothetical protein
MTTRDKLRDYRAKRDPDRTDEPGGGSGHDASSLHFDVRLEIDGVLVSWAVPKGPSTDPRERRLAERGGDENAWLMVKLDDEGADRQRKPASTQPESVLSGRRNEDL